MVDEGFNLLEKCTARYVHFIVITARRGASTQTVDFDSHGPAFLNLFISSDASIYSIMLFPPLGKSDHIIVSVSIDFLSNTKRGARFIAWLMTILVLIGMIFVII